MASKRKRKTTRNDIERFVKKWQQLLGLEGWKITVVWDREDDNYETDGNAWVWRSRDYDVAKVGVNLDEFKGWGLDNAEQVVIHELLHLVTRDVESVMDMIDGQLHRDVYTMVEKSFQHSMEGVIDRLATYLYRLG